MPTYEYECLACKTRFERFQKFADPPVNECPECGSAVRKVLFAAGIVFKGSGWYKTDSRPSTSENGSSTAATSDTKTETKADTKTETKSEGKSEAKSDSASGGSDNKSKSSGNGSKSASSGSSSKSDSSPAPAKS